MNKSIDYKDVPKKYLYCTHKQCPRRNKCLRYQVTLCIPQATLCYTTVNPKHIAGNEDNCTFYQSYQTTHFALGISHLLDNIPHPVAVAIHKDMYSLMGRNMYYRIRNKERMLHPKEQEQIAAIFRKHGVESIPEFDEYIDKFAW